MSDYEVIDLIDSSKTRVTHKVHATHLGQGVMTTKFVEGTPLAQRVFMFLLVVLMFIAVVRHT